MVDWYEVFERYSVLTENGMSDKDAKNYILCKYGCKWHDWLVNRLEQIKKEQEQREAIRLQKMQLHLID